MYQYMTSKSNRTAYRHTHTHSHSNVLYDMKHILQLLGTNVLPTKLLYISCYMTERWIEDKRVAAAFKREGTQSYHRLTKKYYFLLRQILEFNMKTQIMFHSTLPQQKSSKLILSFVTMMMKHFKLFTFKSLSIDSSVITYKSNRKEREKIFYDYSFISIYIE